MSNHNDQIDKIIKALESLKVEKEEKISKELLKKWKNCETKQELKKLNIKELRSLCNHFNIKEDGEKGNLTNRLWKYYESLLESDSESDSESD